MFLFGIISPDLFTTNADEAKEGPYYLNLSLNSFNIDAGVKNIYDATSLTESEVLKGKGSRYFSNLSGLYYFFYFTLIAVFGIYWAVKRKSKIIWKRNLIIILCQWTLWWGIPAFLIVLFGRNVWSPVLLKSINAWPLNMTAFQVNPVAGPGDPNWWNVVGIVGVVWAVILTFIVIPIFTLKFGKIYCSYICSCGALAETVGNSFRHRGPKGDLPRKLEKLGFVFVLFATVATIADLMGASEIFSFYNVWVGTFLAGALAIGTVSVPRPAYLVPHVVSVGVLDELFGDGGRNSKSLRKKGKCIDCNVCNQFCQMGIDIKGRALRGEPVTLVDTTCVGCAECVVRCPMQILHLGDVPEKKLYQLG